MNSFNRRCCALSVAFAIGLLPLRPLAQERPTAVPAEDPQPFPESSEATPLDVMVVTGSATGGVKKLEASYNIVVADAEAIKRANAKSTADLLKIAPGIWTETTGGQTGANIMVAGLPSYSDAPYFTTMLMGSPLYGMPSLPFFETTTILRLDDTVAGLEVLQGGPSAVFASGQMGATGNFLLKTGREIPYGSAGLTWGDEGLWRLDAFSGFPLGQGGWYGSVGGFWRTSQGVREPGFPADEGGQLTGTLSRDFGDGGNVTLYARYLDEKNQFITPIPMIQVGRGEFRAYPGFDPFTGTFHSEALQKVFLPTYPGGGKHVDLADGRGARFFFFGANVDYDFDNGWSASHKLLFDEGDVDTSAVFSGVNPQALADVLYNPDTPVGYVLPPGSATATYVGGGAVPPDQSVIQLALFHIHKRLKSLSNDFRLNKEWLPGHTLTIGLYVNHYTTDDKWSLGNGILVKNEPNATPITVSFVDPADGRVKQRTDAQGFADFRGEHIAGQGSATNIALYLSDSWRVGKWLLDLSGRLENQDAIDNLCNLVEIDLDGNPDTLYDTRVPVCDGTFIRSHYDENHPSWTAGANYTFTDRMSVYGRFSTGGHLLEFGDISDNADGDFAPPREIHTYEAGFKYQSDLLYADISAYRRRFTGLLYQPSDPDGFPIGETRIYGAASYGVNFIGTLTPIDGLRLEVMAYYADGYYTDYDGCFPYFDINEDLACAPIEGQPLARQPRLRWRFTPAYELRFSWGRVTPYVTYSHIGDRTQDESGLQQLGSFHTVDFGVSADVGQQWEFNLRGTNVTNQLAVTESNSNIFGISVSGAENVLLARPLEGREINLQARYRW